MTVFSKLKMDSGEETRKVHLFKREEPERKFSSVRQQLGELKIKCAASLCILLVLLIEALARRIEQKYSEPTVLMLNATNLP